MPKRVHNQQKGGEKASRKCPSCHSKRFWKDGIRKTRNGSVQRYICRDCGYRFSESSVLSMNLSNSGERQVCAILMEAKNLTEAEPLESGLAGATAIDEAEIKGKIVEFAWHLKKQGKSEATIKIYTQYVERLNKAGANIFDPESVKLVIANHFTDRNTKRLATCAYDAFVKFVGKIWDKPNYRREDKPVFIPTDQELQLAVNCGQRESIAFSMLVYETGARYNEAERLEWTDIDAERCKVTIKASKNGKSRTITVTRQLIDALLKLPRLGETVFPPRSWRTRGILFRRRMKRLARVHNNPRFLKIHYHTFRHCKALREYHKTRSMLHVKKVLGHKSILTTQRYVELYTEIYGDILPEDYVCETASTVDEAKKLVEAGFDYVSEIDGIQLYRKVK